MKGELVLFDNIYEDDSEFELGVSVYDFSLLIYVDDEKTLENQLKNKDAFYKSMDTLKEFNEYYDIIDEEQQNEIDYITSHFDNLLDSVEYIRLKFEEQDEKEFIKNNTIVLSKKIVLDDVLEITEYDKLMKLIEKYKYIIDKVYVTLVGNENYVSLLDCYKTMSVVKKQAEEIKNLGLSPMETIMYVYDQVRNRVYTFENEEESCFKSRDLTEVMFGDKIVCVGYANIFYTLLTYLGIKNRQVNLTDKNDMENNGGHVRNVVYVQDPKYDIDGVYYFDPTWNSKRKNETNEYLYRYTYFAKTRKFMDEHNNYDFEDKFFPIYSVDMDKEIRKIIEEGDYEKLEPYIISLNYMSRLVNQDNLIEYETFIQISSLYGKFDKEEFLKKFEEVFSKFNKELSAETMINLLNNVRKVEYYQDSELYPYSLDDIYKTFLCSKWEFKDNYLDPAVKFIYTIFGEEIDPFDDFKKYGHDSGVFKEVEQVRLTKVLKNIYSRKTKQ